MLEITFFNENDNKYTVQTFTGETVAIGATLAMAEHITKGGWCLAEYENRSTMVTSLKQLGL